MKNIGSYFLEVSDLLTKSNDYQTTPTPDHIFLPPLEKWSDIQTKFFNHL